MQNMKLVQTSKPVCAQSTDKVLVEFWKSEMTSATLPTVASVLPPKDNVGFGLLRLFSVWVRCFLW